MKVVIVGGVAGGAGAAARLRRNDEAASIVLLEKGAHISFANCGLPYYIGGVIRGQERLLLETPESFCAQFNVDVRVNNECLSVDTAAKSVQVKRLSTGEVYTESYDKLILSPGARPLRPPIPGMDDAFTLRTIPDAAAICQYIEEKKPKTCAIVGGGFIGLEMAENLIHKGVDVSVVEAAPHVIGPLDMDMAHGVHNYLRQKGVRLYLGAMAAKRKGNRLILSDGREVEADMAILSAGVAPETGFLSGSGIVLGARREIVVNEYLETSVPGVYAVGDAIAVRHIVSGRQAVIPLASPANRQAKLAADNVCGMARPYKGAQGTAIVQLFDMTVAVTGESEASLLLAGRPFMKSITFSPSNAGYYPGGQMMGVKLLYAPEDGRLYGAQITGGKGVDKRMDVLATAIRAQMTVYDLQELELSYAPPFSSAKDPVNMAGYVAGNLLDKRSTPLYVEQLERMRANAMLLDVRTPREFEKGTIPGAVNIPLHQLRARLIELDISREIIILCQVGQRGYNAERILRQRGYKVCNLIGGYRLYQERELDV